MGSGVYVEMKKTTLIKFFTVYTMKVILIPIIISLLAIILFVISIQFKILNPANYEQKLIESSIETIEKAENVEEYMIPEPLKYIIIDKNKKKVLDSGNMDSTTKKKALEYVVNSSWPSGLDNPYFASIERKDEICIIKYSVIVKFSNEMLRNIIPYPGLTFIIICIISFIIILIILSKKTSNKVQIELQKILKTTEKIKEQDLDFISEVNNIKEFNTVSESLDSLRDALKTSLREQIEIEKNKVEQISALAHDIKIPITIIKGNSELLSIKNNNKEEEVFIDDIISASNQIELYTQSLIDISKMSSKVELKKNYVFLSDFLNKLQKEAEVLGKTKQCKVIFNNNIVNNISINIDINRVHRALMNVIANGIEHMDRLTNMSVTIYKREENKLIIEVQDSGEGFSKEALKKGTLMFFTEDKARTGKHNGIGLNFAENVAKAHGGELSLGNNNTGGLVKFSIYI